MFGCSSLFRGVGLLMFCQVSFLPETFPTKLAGEGFLPCVCPHVNVDTVLVFESLVADVTVMQEPRLLLGFIFRSSVIFSHFGKLGQLGLVV